MTSLGRRDGNRLSAERPKSPLSPTSALVHRQISSMPPVAVVHDAKFDVLKAGDLYPASPPWSRQSGASPSLPYLADASSMTAQSQGTLMETSLSSSFSDAHPAERMVKRRAFKRSTSVPNVTVPAAKDAEIRVLSQAEQDMRSKAAIKHFRHMAVINNRARTIEDVDLAMARIRMKKLTSISSIDEGDAKKQPAKSSAYVQPTEAKAQPKPDPPKAKAKAEPVQEVKAEEPAPAEEKPKMSLADRMGFGVKTKAQNKWSKLKASVDVSAALKSAVGEKQTVQITGAKTGVSVGSTNLKAVLAEKRAKAAEEMKAFEKMNLPVQEFVQTFRTNVDLVMKVSKTTGIPYGDLKALDNATLTGWFHQMDTDKSGTLDFAEFIEGLMKISQTQEFQNIQLARTGTPLED